ncbi:MAG: TonB-dependent receptor [Kangiellaceae bacterium]|nr:TonB-dependent receptor [Kangiellaceae bacterium]
MKTNKFKFRPLSAAMRTVLFTAATGLLAMNTASIQAAEQDEEAKEDNKITITGSRIKRNQAEGAKPITIITADDILNRGYVTVHEALNDLSKNTGIQIEGPEFSSGFTPAVETINLNGAGVGSTVTLINGRRVSDYPAAYQSTGSVFDFGAIPAIAVHRIEVMSTGGSAIYGADAVAGVINIILKEDVDDYVATYLHGQQGAGKTTDRFQFLGGKTFDGGNITFAYEYQEREGVYGPDYDQFDSELDFPYEGVPILARGIYNINNYFQFGDPSLGNDNYITPPAGSCEALNNGFVQTTRPAGSGSLTGDDRIYCGYDLAQDVSFRNPSTRHSIFIDSKIELGGDLEWFGTMLVNTSEVESHDNALTLAADFVDPNNFNAAFGLPQWSSVLRRITAAEFGRETLSSTYDSEALSISTGLTGLWGENDWEISLTHSENSLDQAQPWFKAQETIDIFMGTWTDVDQIVGPIGLSWIDGWDNSGEFSLIDNLWSPIPQQYLDRVLGEQTYRNESSSTQLQFVLSGDVGELDGGPIGYAIVAEYEEEEINYIPDALLLQDSPDPNVNGTGWWGLTGFFGEGDRQRSALGGEMVLPFSDTFTVNLAGRFDTYDNTSSSIGTRFTPGVDFEWRPTDSLLVRGGHSGAFITPDMVMVHINSGFFTGGTDLVGCFERYAADNNIDVSTYANLDAAGQQAMRDAMGDFQDDCESQSVYAERTGSQNLGEDALKDETGHSSHIGFVYDINDDNSLEMTWSQQYLKDRAVTESVQGLLNDEYLCSAYNNIVQLDPTPNQSECDRAANRVTDGRSTGMLNGLPISQLGDFNVTPVNQAEQLITSFDLKFRNRFETEIGTFRTYVEYTNIIDNKSRSSAGDDWFNRRSSLGFSGYNFRSRLNVSFGYEADDFRTTLTAIYVGSSPKWNINNVETDVDGNFTEDPRIDPFTTFNYSAVYDFTPDLSVALRVSNLLDEEAPRDDTFEYYEYPWYNNFMYGGAGLGRDWSLEAQYRF